MFIRRQLGNAGIILSRQNFIVLSDTMKVFPWESIGEMVCLEQKEKLNEQWD